MCHYETSRLLDLDRSIVLSIEMVFIRFFFFFLFFFYFVFFFFFFFLKRHSVAQWFVDGRSSRTNRIALVSKLRTMRRTKYI